MHLEDAAYVELLQSFAQNGAAGKEPGQAAGWGGVNAETEAYGGAVIPCCVCGEGAD
jgi:hypothetical protein